MSNKQKCGLCGGTGFFVTDGNTYWWMFVACHSCALVMELRKLDYATYAHEEPNYSHAVKRYCEHTAKIRGNIVKEIL